MRKPNVHSHALFFLILVLTFSTESSAGWVKLCEGGQLDSAPYITAMGVNETAIYIGTGFGNVFTSVDNGASWKPVTYVSQDTLDTIRNTMGNVWVSTFAFNGPNVFMGTYNAGVYLSTNNGASWNLLDIGLTRMEFDVNSFAISGNTIWISVNVQNHYDRVFLSTDNGATWKACNTTEGLRAHSLALSGTNIFTGSWSGISHSTNNGISWQSVNYGLTDLWVNAVAKSGNNLLAGTYSHGVFLSVDNGFSWQAAGPGLPLYNSINTFLECGIGTAAGSDHGIFLSENNGSSWTNISSGLVDSSIGSLAANSTNMFALKGDSFQGYGPLYYRPLSEIAAIASSPHLSKEKTNSIKIGNNTASASTSIAFTLPEPSSVNLTVFSPSGRKIATVFDGKKNAGTQNILWDHKGIPGGIYLVALKTEKTVIRQTVHLW